MHSVQNVYRCLQTAQKLLRKIFILKYLNAQFLIHSPLSLSFSALVVKLCGDYLKKRSKFTHVNYKTSKERRQCKDESLFTCLSLSVCVLAQIYLILSPFECEIYFPIRKILITHGICWLFRSLRKKYPKRVASAENMWHLYSASKDTEKRFGGVFFCYFSVHSIF